HDLDELASTLGVLEHLGLLGELAVQVVEERRGLRDLVQALPIPAVLRPSPVAGRGNLEGHGHGGDLGSAHRWQVEQVVWVLMSYFFMSSRPSSSWLAGAS